MVLDCKRRPVPLHTLHLVHLHRLNKGNPSFLTLPQPLQFWHITTSSLGYLLLILIISGPWRNRTSQCAITLRRNTHTHCIRWSLLRGRIVANLVRLVVLHLVPYISLSLVFYGVRPKTTTNQPIILGLPT